MSLAGEKKKLTRAKINLSEDPLAVNLILLKGNKN